MKTVNRLNRTTVRDQAVADVKEISLLALIITAITSFLEIPALLAYYAVKFAVTWLLAAAGFLGWRLLVWAWARSVAKRAAK